MSTRLELRDNEKQGKKKKKKKVVLPRTTSAVFKKHMSIIGNMEDSIQDEHQRREFAIAKMGVEAILKEHMPRDSEIETAGAFFRKLPSRKVRWI